MNENTNTPQNQKPSWLPVKCALCEGWGSFSHGTVPCKACNGLGYLKVPPKEEDGEENGHV